MGPVGFEPTTKGFTSIPVFPPGVDYLFTREHRDTRGARGCGMLAPVIKGTEALR